MITWGRFELDDWAEVVEHMAAAPWSRGAVRTDLRWWSKMQEAGRVRRLPNSKALAARWHWTEWSVRNLLKAEDWWRDTFAREDSANVPRNGREDSANGKTDERHDSDEGRETGAKIPRNGREDSATRALDLQGQVQVQDPIRSDLPPVDPVGEPSAGSHLRLVPLTPERPDPMPAALVAVYERWRTYHPTARTEPGAWLVRPTNQKTRAAIRETLEDLRVDNNGDLEAALGEAIDLVDAAHLAPSLDYLRRNLDRRKPNGEPRDHLGLATIFKREKRDDRLAKSREWVARGRVPDDTLGREGLDEEAKNAWTWVDGIARSGARGLPQATLDAMREKTPEKLAALEAGLNACNGFGNVCRSTERETPALRAAFVAAYVETRAETAKHRRNATDAAT